MKDLAVSGFRLTVDHVLLTPGVGRFFNRVPAREFEQHALDWEREELQVSLYFHTHVQFVKTF